jgi:hypothetical protein
MSPLPTSPPLDPASPRQEFRFECVRAYEIVPVDTDSYRMVVPTRALLFAPQDVADANDAVGRMVGAIGAAQQRSEQHAAEYCAKMNRKVKVSSVAFDMGPGLTLIFKCIS